MRRRLDNVLVELDIIREALEKSGQHPPCCLTVDKDERICCDAYGPLSKVEFLTKCRECRTILEKFLVGVEEHQPKSTV